MQKKVYECDGDHARIYPTKTVNPVEDGWIIVAHDIEGNNAIVVMRIESNYQNDPQHKHFCSIQCAHDFMEDCLFPPAPAHAEKKESND